MTKNVHVALQLLLLAAAFAAVARAACRVVGEGAERRVAPLGLQATNLDLHAAHGAIRVMIAHKRGSDAGLVPTGSRDYRLDHKMVVLRDDGWRAARAVIVDAHLGEVRHGHARL